MFFVMFWAFVRQWELCSSTKGRRGQPTMFWDVLKVLFVQ